MKHQDRHGVLAASMAVLEESLERLSAGSYRDYCKWALSGSHRESWLQLMGLSGLVRLTVALLEGLVTDSEWRTLARHAALISVQQVYEVVSDNLAIGLAHPDPNDTTWVVRRELLTAFNREMIGRLHGSPENGLSVHREMAHRISCFEQSLSPEKHAAMRKAFLENGGTEDRPRAIEYAIWPLLVGGIEITAALSERLGPHPLAPMVKKGLVQRYSGVNGVLAASQSSHATSLDTRLALGRDTIMVIPTLAYYVAGLSEVRPLRNLERCVGILDDAFSDAALAVRLLNDLGTSLCLQREDERAALEISLRARLAASGAPNLRALLLEHGDESAALFTRLRKDLIHREFNVCLPRALAVDMPAAEALTRFMADLADAGLAYRKCRERLEGALDALCKHLEDERPSRLIGRFVDFHATLYSKTYRSAEGEYAV